jgi:beta-lactamase regulating signal transducer with metallopeptidase domain
MTDAIPTALFASGLSLADLAANAVKVALLFAVAWGIARFCLRSAAGRHLVWTAAAATACVLPLAAALVPTVGVPVPGRWMAATASLPAVEFSEVVIDTEVETVAPSAAAYEADLRFFEPLVAEMPEMPEMQSTVSTPTAAVERAPHRGWLTGLWALYLAGLVMSLLPWGVGLVARRRLEAGARPLDDPAWQLELEELRRELGVRRPVRLLVGPRRMVPMTWGLLTPAVLVPEGATDWDADRRRSVLAHELAHVARGDVGSLAVARLTTALYWFHPLAWVASRRIAALAEHAADDSVLALDRAPRASSYAQHLLEVARLLQAGRVGGRWPAPAAGLAMARSSKLGERIAAILDDGRTRRGPGRRGATLLGAGVVLAGLCLAALGCVVGTESHVEISSHDATGDYFDGARCKSNLLGVKRNGVWAESRDGDWTVTLQNGSCELSAAWSGDVELTDDDSGVSLGRGATFELTETTEDDEVQVVARPGAGGTTEYSWTRDGEEVAETPELRAWLGRAVPALLRASGIQAEERVARIYRRSGFDGVMEEIARIPGDSSASRYLGALLAEGLGPSETGQALEWAGEHVDSDYALRRVAEAALDRSDEGSEVDGNLAVQVLALGRTIDSDYELSELLIAVTERLAGGTPLPPDYFETVARIDSDYEIRRALEAAIDRGDLEDTTVGAVLEAVARIDSGFEARTVLEALADTGAVTGERAAEYRQAAERIPPGFERQQALAALERR